MTDGEYPYADVPSEVTKMIVELQFGNVKSILAFRQACYLVHELERDYPWIEELKDLRRRMVYLKNHVQFGVPEAIPDE